MGVSASSLTPDMTPETLEGYKAELLTKCEEILVENPGNRCCKYVIKYLESEEGKELSVEGEMVVSSLVFIVGGEELLYAVEFDF